MIKQQHNKHEILVIITISPHGYTSTSIVLEFVYSKMCILVQSI